MIRSIILYKESTSQNFEVVFTLKKAQLLHEIADYGFDEGEIMPADAIKNKQLTQDIVQGNNALRITRYMDMKLQQVISVMTPYADVAIEDNEERDNVPNHEAEYKITIKVNSDFTVQKINRLAELIPNYLVFSSLAHWLGITNAEASVKWKTEADEILEKIGEMRFGSFVARRPFYPFGR